MKKHILRIVLLLTMSVLFSQGLIEASFLDKDSRYIKVEKDLTMVRYLDDKSIESIRYDPPFYTIGYSLYEDDLVYNVVIKRDVRTFYNFYTKQIQTHDSTKYGWFSEDGEFIKNTILENEEPRTIPMIHDGKIKCSRLIANLAFIKCYRMPFDSELNK